MLYDGQDNTVTQQANILRHMLLRKTGINAYDAFQRYGCLRLAARIYNLRALGWFITSTTVRKGNKTYTQYTIDVDTANNTVMYNRWKEQQRTKRKKEARNAH